MPRRRRVFIDTRELYPFTIMDVLLTRNTKDCPIDKLAADGVQVVTADDPVSSTRPVRERT